jgi:glycine/D-amino acid oxidase-like deaminating enzyme/nitrite reductase/ring-hydroxylating ferredoxin subunit
MPIVIRQGEIPELRAILAILFIYFSFFMALGKILSNRGDIKMISLHHGESVSSWMQTVQMPKFSPLLQNIETDVCIIGAGLAGLTTAYLLQQEGRKVCVLEGFEVGSGQSGRTTAHFTYALDKGYQHLEKVHGEDGIKLVAQSHYEALKKVKEIISKENIDCEMERVNGYLFTASDEIPNYTLQSNREKSHHQLSNELESILRAGLSDVYMTEKIPLHSFDPGSALCYPDQIQLHPLKYIKALSEIIVSRGGEIYTNSHVTEVHGGDNAFVKLQNEKTVKCNSVVVATNSPINDLVAIHTKQMSYRTYVIGVEVPKGKLIKGLYWDTAEPYHFIRLEKCEGYQYEVLLVGGEDHKTGQNDNPEHSYTKLENWMRKRFPDAGRVLFRWSGHVMEPVDGLAYIGRNPMDKDNVYVVTGHSGNGMTYSTIAGMLLTDLILGRENPWTEIYHPSRISLSTAGTYFRENANTLAQYKDWIFEPTTNSQSMEDLSPGDGMVYRDGLHIVAAYKDDRGNLTLNSAVCTHLGGIVRWNAAEKSWDCPCHGSRYDCQGKVMEGPAIHDLAPFKEGALHPPDVLKISDDFVGATPVF